jgi:hypothetical protein
MKPLRLLLAIVALALCGDLVAKTPVTKNKKAIPAGKFPTFETVSRTVAKQLAARDSYRSGDLLTASTVESLFRKLEKINWKVADRKDILKSVLSDSDWMARQFSTQNGRDFMRQVAELPGGYDRVDHLRRMPYGQQQMADLMRGPDGYKLFEYMTTTQGGKNLGNMLSQGVNGENFNRPTGRIYTEIDLIKRLKKSYDAETVRRLSVETPPQAEERQSSSKKEPTAPAAPGTKTTKPPQQPVSDDPFENLPRN